MRTPDDIHDEWLVLRCHEGDTTAFNELVARWQPRLLRHAMRLTGLPDAAGNVVQAAWVAILRGLNQIEDPACFDAGHIKLQLTSAPIGFASDSEFARASSR